jgi:hypothetical protein
MHLMLFSKSLPHARRISCVRSRTHGLGHTVSDTRSRTYGLGLTVLDPQSRTHGLLMHLFVFVTSRPAGHDEMHLMLFSKSLPHARRIYVMGYTDAACMPPTGQHTTYCLQRHIFMPGIACQASCVLCILCLCHGIHRRRMHASLRAAHDLLPSTTYFHAWHRVPGIS